MGIFFEKCPAWAGRMMMMPRPWPDDERRTLVVRLLLRSATATAPVVLVVLSSLSCE